MSNEARRLERRKARAAARAIADRRRHSRVAPSLNAQALYENGREASCRLVNISVGGVAAQTAKTPRVNSRIVLVIDGVGRMDGVVSRVSGDRFSVNFDTATERRQIRMADQLAWEVNRVALDLADDRRAPRRYWTGPARITFDDGVEAHARYINKSDVGASFVALERPRDGEPARVEARPGRIARKHARGFAVDFTAPCERA